MKKILTIILSLGLIFSMTCFASGFSDLSSNHWAYKNISTLAESGVINGYPDGTFKPENTITRGEFFKLIMTASEGEEFFALANLVASSWTAPYMNYAENRGLMMNGTSTEGADEQITRLEMAVVLSKVANDKNIKRSYSDDGTGVVEDIGFNDISNLSKLDQAYINKVADLGLVRGYTDGSFKPNGYMTRAEVATIIYRFLTIK